MAEPVSIYLNDHIGGAQIALQLLEAMRDHHDDRHYREFADRLLPEIGSDDDTLRAIAAKIGGGPSAIKTAGGWLVEKAARWKLGHTGSTGLDLFESLELLLLGIHGKLCLWKALRTASTLDARLREYDFDSLMGRANDQHELVERERLALAVRILAGGAGQ